MAATGTLTEDAALEKWSGIIDEEGYFNRVATFIHDWSKARGFYPPLEGKCEKLILIVSEIIEAVEELRKGDKEAHDMEIVDVLIRLLDYAVWQQIDLDAGLVAKMAKNEGRPYKHGKKF